MTQSIFFIILLAAMLHALWNAMIKHAQDRLIALGCVALGNVIIGVSMVFFLPLPEWQSWPYILASTLIHIGYYFMLYHAYRFGDLSQVYPIARGSVPIFVTVGAYIFAGETLPLQGWIGIFIVSGGIFLLSYGYFDKKFKKQSIFLALATGMVITSYSIIDGLGARLAGNAFSYVAWLLILEFWMIIFVLSKRRKALLSISFNSWLLGISAGVFSAFAYIFVIYAKTVTALGLVSALRESSVIFATLIGLIWLKESGWKIRLSSSFIVVAGIFLLILAG